ncbi:phage portal protein [Microbacterium sp. MYb72]|uniref:phage portal protein n=1 Tax=Microbacterium sp. MYb72 TaxID=1848693 RepID=UPI0015E2B2E9|nr:phage portal protein [Microbacterium sp. MYb72]
MVFAVSEGKLLAVQKPSYQAPTALRISDDLSQDYSSIYRQQPSVRTVVDFLARNVAQLSLHTFRRLDDSDRARVTDHPFAQMMRTPNPYTTGYRLIFSLIADRGIYDRALWVKVFQDGKSMLVRIPPRLWTIKDDDNWLAPTEFIVKGNKGKTTLAAKDVVYFRGYNPEDERYGLSPIESLRRVLSEEYAAGQMREQAMRNGARIGGYIQRPAGAPEWSDPARQRFATGWRSQYAGQTATEGGGTPVLEDGMTFVAAGHSAKDMQYIEARKLSREEAAAAYFIPPPMVGILDHATFGNIEEQHKMLYQDTLGPILQEVQQEIALQILPDFDDADDLYNEFNMLEKLRGSFEEQASQMQSSVGAPFLTRNEARAKLNLPRIEGADELVVPLNVLVGGLASPTDQVSAGSGGGSLPELEATTSDALTADEIQTLVNAAATLIRSGFDPVEALIAVGLDPIKHLGLLPVTVQRPQEPENVDQEAVDDLKGRVVRVKSRPSAAQVAKSAQVLTEFFDRQERSVRSALGAKDADWWDGERWDRELGGALLALSSSITTAVARKQLERLGVDPDEYDVDRTMAWMRKVASANASSINAATEAAVTAAIASDEDTPAAVAHVFDVAKSARAQQGGLTLATSLAGFASVEAVQQVRGTRSATKTWIVTSSNPRASHAAMAGQTVPIDSTFTNGAKWPGDSSALDVDEVAGCSCDVEINFE